jgi:hypothetical protein
MTQFQSSIVCLLIGMSMFLTNVFLYYCSPSIFIKFAAIGCTFIGTIGALVIMFSAD